MSPFLSCLMLNVVAFVVQRQMVAGAGGDAASRAMGKKKSMVARSSAGTPCARAALCACARSRSWLHVCMGTNLAQIAARSSGRFRASGLPFIS